MERGKNRIMGNGSKVDSEGLGVMGVFRYLDELLVGIGALKKANMTIESIFSPTPCREIQEVLGFSPSPVRYFTLVGGILGALGGFGLAIYAHSQWEFVSGGKPVVAWIPFIVIGFECCILLGVISTLLGMMIKNRMPRFRISDSYDPRFSQDRFGVLVSCREGEQHRVSSLLKGAGAEDVREVTRIKGRPKMPRTAGVS
jgi:hypothetical protein